MCSRLQAYCARAFPARHGVRVSDLTNITIGWESEMYSFAVEYGPAGERQREELVMRIYPGRDAHHKSGREFHGMSQLHKVGYPVPQVLLLERDRSPFGKPFIIMEKIKGRVMMSLWASSPQEKQWELLTLFCKLLVQLHTLEWRPFVRDGARADTQDTYAFVDCELDKRRSRLTRFPVAGFAPVMEWLEARRDQVPCLHPSLIHGDFHPDNILLRDDGSAIVIDWTQVGISDPRFDLAWTLLLASTHANVTLSDLMLQEYERLVGAAIEQLDYFQVFACLKRLYGVTASYSYGPENLGMRPDALATMGTLIDAFKKVYDLLLEKTGIRVTEVEKLFASSF